MRAASPPRKRRLFFSCFIPFSNSWVLAHAVFQATQDFYKQDIGMQKATARACSVSTLEVGLLSASSNVLQAIYCLENAARNYRDATKEHDHLTAIYAI